MLSVGNSSVFLINMSADPLYFSFDLTLLGLLAHDIQPVVIDLV